MMIMLKLGELILKLPLMVIKHERDDANDFFTRIPLFIHQDLANQVTHRFGAIGIAMCAQMPVKLRKQTVVHGDREAFHTLPFRLLRFCGNRFARLELRKQNDVADGIRPAQKHHEAVNADPHPAGRRHAVFERGEKVLINF